MERLFGEACGSFLTDTVDSLIREVAFEAHRDLRQGSYLAPCAVLYRRPSSLPSSSCRLLSSEAATQAPGADLFAQELCQAPPATAACTSCGRSVAAARYAPHLEKCMGLGRSSSRIANQRLATYSSSSSEARVDVYGGSSRSLLEEDGGSDTEYKEPKAPKSSRKRGRTASPRAPPSRSSSVSSPSASSSSLSSGGAIAASSPPVAKKPKGRPRKHAPKELIEPLKAQSQAKIKAMLEETCGVVHPQSGKMCQGPLDCAEHSLSQQQHIRNALLGRKAGRLFREEQERRMGYH